MMIIKFRAIRWLQVRSSSRSESKGRHISYVHASSRYRVYSINGTSLDDWFTRSFSKSEDSALTFSVSRFRRGSL